MMPTGQAKSGTYSTTRKATQAGRRARRQALRQGRHTCRQGMQADAPVAHSVLPQHVSVVQHLDDVGKQLQQAAVLVARHLHRGLGALWGIL
jgi:ribosomal protein RSM22 (predicted rRNA methylase)